MEFIPYLPLHENLFTKFYTPTYLHYAFKTQGVTSAVHELNWPISQAMRLMVTPYMQFWYLWPSRMMNPHKCSTTTDCFKIFSGQSTWYSTPRFLLLHLKIYSPAITAPAEQLHIVTGLTFHIFWVNVSNFNTKQMKCLPKGHRPGRKSGNKDTSMLYHSITISKLTSNVTRGIAVLKLHAGNFGGQNKNKFMLWYFLWRVPTQV